MQKILLLSYSGQYGGMEKRIVQEAVYLKSMNYDVAVGISSFPNSEKLINDLAAYDISATYYNPPMFFEEWRWRRQKKLLAEIFWCRYIKKMKPSLIHIFYCWTEMGCTRLWLAHKCNVPCVLSVHNVFPAHKYLPWHDDLMQQAFESVKGLYAVSQQALDSFLSTYQKYIHNDTRLETIYNFVDTKRFQPSNERRQQTRAKFSITDNQLLLGFSGRLDKQKRPDLLIAVFGQLNKRFPNSRLAIVGEGPLEKQCREQANQLGLSKCVLFWGFQNNIEEILPAFDLFVLLSIREGLSLATIEAMACGVPVVATDVPGSHEVFINSSSGILVHAGDENKIVEAIANLIEDNCKREEMALAGSIEAAEKYSRENWENKIKDFYQAIL
ncbi:MAG: glycosyltransferase [Methylococcaceae bacterium]|nr:glycosyltransferase [Methylococcaceae bacterium]